jgi:ELWxxDGT repeat protein
MLFFNLTRLKKTSIWLAALFFGNILLAQSPELLKDCNPSNASSNQYGHTPSGNALFFVSDDGINGEELWKTDGTEQGTVMVKNIGFEHFRSFPKELTDVNGNLFFTANDEKHGYELWKSNGTELGTVLVKDINKGKSSSQPTCLTAFNHKLYFVINEGGQYSQIWTSDGTEQGTVSIAKIQQSDKKIKITNLVDRGNSLYLIGEIDGNTAYWYLSNKNNEIKFIKTKEHKAKQGFVSFAGIQNQLVFTDSELWIFNSETMAIKMIKDNHPGGKSTQPNHLMNHGKQVFFTINNLKNETEFWQTDGTFIGTKAIGKLSVMPYSLIDIQYAAEGDYLFLSVTDKNNATGKHQVFQYKKSSNTLETIGSFKINEEEQRIALMQNTLFIKQAVSLAENGLIIMDCKTMKQTAVLLKQKNAIRSSVQRIFQWQNKIWMVADDGINGVELFNYQLNINQINLIKNINKKGLGSYPYGFTKMGQKFTFFTSPESGRSELWISDASERNTQFLKSFFLSEDDMIDGIAAMDGKLYFFKRNFKKYEFWQSDGSEAGTKMLQTIEIGEAAVSEKKSKAKKDIQQFYPISIIAHKGKLFFNLYNIQSGNELWSFDVKQKEAKLLKDINKGDKASDPSYFIVFKDLVYFNATTYNEGSELWKTDGTISGTVMVKDIWHGANNSTPAHFAVMGNEMYFAATSEKHGDELWKTDGTNVGTVFVKDINTGEEDSNPEDLTVVGQRLFFTANNGKQGTELWVSDGTGDGTKMVKDIYAGGESSSPKNLIAFNNALYFIAEDVDYGNELWVSDGTEKGTDLLNDLKKGRGHAFITELTIAKNSLYFKAANGENNPELWKTNGKSSNTSMVEGSYSIENTLPPMNLFEFNGMLLYVVDEKKNGAEIWIIK